MDIAKGEYSLALSLFPTFASALQRRGMIWEALGGSSKGGQRSTDFVNARNDYGWAAYYDTQFPLPFFSAGLVLKQMDKQNEALAYYSKCVSLEPDCAAAHNNLGLIYVDNKTSLKKQKRNSMKSSA